MKKHFTILTVFVFIFLQAVPENVQGQVTITLTDTTPVQLIGKSIYYLIDTTEKLHLEDIIQPAIDQKFVRSTQEVPNFGNVHLTIWNKIVVANNSTNNWILFDLNDNDTLTFFYKDSANIYHKIVSGASMPLSSRKYKTNVFAFDLPVNPGDTAVFYLKVETRNCEYALMISSYGDFVQDQFTRILAKGIYFGLVLLIIIYNIALYIAIKERTYLYYILYVLFTSLLIAVMSGIYPFILQDKLHFLWDSGPVIAALGGIFLCMFSKSFLQLKEVAPRMNLVINYLVMPLLFLNILLTIAGKVLLASVLNQFIGLAGLITLSATAIYAYIKGFKAARFYILACSFYFIGVFVYVFKVSGFFPSNFITAHAMETGSALEMILFSVSMGDRINIYRKEKSKAQKELIHSLQERTVMQHEMLELEAKALRSQMNPHFIFNCMNSIKALIQQKEEEKAINYLTTFSKLLRTILQNSDKREITLHDEIETCRLYTQLESFRFGNKFSYDFEINNDIDLKSIQVPALILQPFIENAVWHGIMPKENGGYIKVRIERNDGAISCIIDDNGVGRESSLKNKFKHPPSTHQSKGVKLTQSRLDLDNALNNRNATVHIIDKKNENKEPEGTTVILTFKEY